MKVFTLATLMTLAASPVFAFNLSDAANAVLSSPRSVSSSCIVAIINIETGDLGCSRSA